MFSLYMLQHVQFVYVATCSVCVCCNMFSLCMLQHVQFVYVATCSVCVCCNMFSLCMLQHVQFAYVATCSVCHFIIPVHWVTVSCSGDWGIMTGTGCGRKRPWPDRGIIPLYDWRVWGKSVKIINKGHYGKQRDIGFSRSIDLYYGQPVIWKSVVILKRHTGLLS
jgi:hypothetical protein